MRTVAWVVAGVLATLPAWAATVSEFVPQGVVGAVSSVQIQFDDDMVPFGAAQLPAPLALSCSGATVQGAGRWLDSRRWTYEFTEALPAGVQCRALLRADLRSLGDAAIQGPAEFSFSTGAPQLLASLPYGSPIDEDQVFVLRFNGPVDAASVQENSRCVVDGIGEAIPVRRITPAQRAQVLDTLWDTRFDASEATQLLQCARLLPPDASVRIEIGPGVGSAAQDDAALVTQAAEVLEYTVRPVFTAEMNCGRENPRAACMPLQSVGVRFSAPVARAQAAAIRLQLPDGARSPALDDAQDDGPLTWVGFPGPFPAGVDAVLHLPADLHDDAGRQLINAPAFPLEFRIGDYPPLVKFASDAFGIVERFAAVPDGASEEAYPPTLPLSLRHVEADLLTREMLQSAGALRDRVVQEDREALRWLARVQRLQYGEWSPMQFEQIKRLAPITYEGQSGYVDARRLSLLADEPDARRVTLPGATAVADPALRPFEVIGVPVPEPGLHVLEIESPRLGQALLAQDQPMFVRTLALVTNLSVHLKLGRDDALVWVTTLDDAQVVPQAEVSLLDCRGLRLAQGRTDDNGLLHVRQALPGDTYCSDTGLSGVFAAARIDASHSQAGGKADFAFVLSSWDDGIESWRFNLPLDTGKNPTRRVHTVLDRSLFRPGETVSMKHFLRLETRDGLAVPDADLPDAVLITPIGLDQTTRLPVQWQTTPSGGLFAESRYRLPETASMGSYHVRLSDAEERWYEGVDFKVAAFRLPVFGGALQIQGGQGGAPLVAPEALALDVQVNYLAGGPAARLPVRLSALAEDAAPYFPAFEAFSFERPEPADASARERAPRLFLDKQAVQLDGSGAARLALPVPEGLDYPQQWTLEASFTDPSGETQTLMQRAYAWPADVQPGIRTEPWTGGDAPIALQVVALDPGGQARAGVPVTVTGVHHRVFTTRKRLVGGFYSYDNQRQARPLGVLCEGVTQDDGRFHCAPSVAVEGSLELIATVQDEQGRTASSATQTWVSGSMAAWFGANDDDRIDLVPARPEWAVGDTAQFQVRMPFRSARALVSVEREGVLQTWVQSLTAADPVIHVPVQAQWAPNAYVSVLLMRGRLRGDGQAPAPGTTVDLAKPSFRFGVAPLRVANDAHRLQVAVHADRSRYQVGETVSVDVQVTRSDGQPAAGGSVAFAAVDQALLELAPNATWDVLEAMYPTRGYGVRTATAQMQVVGRRHYGRKAVPAGGGGGASPTRELLDTLVSWQPDVRLDAQGRARIAFPLNDAITRFALVAIADHGSDGFGSGRADIVSTRDLYLIPALPARVRQGDEYLAQWTLRNTTVRPMTVDVSVQAREADGAPFSGFPLTLRERIVLAPGAAQRVPIAVTVPSDATLARAREVIWTVQAHEADPALEGEAAMDALRIVQQVAPLIAVDVQQASARVLQHQQVQQYALAPPPQALRDDKGVVLGGIRLDASVGPQASLEGARRWFGTLDFGSLQMKASRWLGLADEAGWAALMARLPEYLDGDGLAGWYPGGDIGNEVLTAYLLSVSDDALALGGRFAIPEALRSRMLDGLQAFVEGRIVRYRYAPLRDLELRKLMAMEALSRYGRMRMGMLDTVGGDPRAWHTSALIDAIGVLQRTPGLPEREQAIAHLAQIIKSRSVVSGRARVLTDSTLNASPWLMASTAVNQARLALASLQWPDWADERQALLQGLIDMQWRGHWGSSTANVYAGLALRAYDVAYPAHAVRGEIHAQNDAGVALGTLMLDGADVAQGRDHAGALIPWEAVQGEGEPAAQAGLALRYQGAGQPWLSVQALAAVRRSAPVSAGMQVSRSVQPLLQWQPGQWSQGDTYRVRLTLHTPVPRFWVAVSDAIPSGATILGSGLGRESVLPMAPAETPEQDSGWWPSHVERRDDGLQATYEYLPAGTTVLDYAVRLDTAGRFTLPPARAQALYEPDVFGQEAMGEPLRVRERSD